MLPDPGEAVAYPVGKPLGVAGVGEPDPYRPAVDRDRDGHRVVRVVGCQGSAGQRPHVVGRIGRRGGLALLGVGDVDGTVARPFVVEYLPVPTSYRTTLDAVPGATIRVHRSSADAFLRASTASYDLIFVDPPYDVADDELAQTLALAGERSAPDAWIIVERAARSPEPVSPTGFGVVRSKRYGDTALWWAVPASRPVADDQPPAESQSR